MSMLNLSIPNPNITKTIQTLAIRVEDKHIFLYKKIRMEIVDIVDIKNQNQYQIFTSNVHGFVEGQRIFIQNSNVFDGYHFVVSCGLNKRSFVIEFQNKHDEFIGKIGFVYDETKKYKKIDTNKDYLLEDKEIQNIGNPLCNQLTTPEGRLGEVLKLNSNNSNNSNNSKNIK
jgi:hypothetical protein